MSLPTKVLRLGKLKIAEFQKEMQGNNGPYMSKSYNVQKSWKDKDGNWQKSDITIFDNELIDLVVLSLSMANRCMVIEETIKPNNREINPIQDSDF